MNSDTLIAHRFRLMTTSNEVARVSFHDGDIYDLRILSDMHAEEGGDVVAEIVGIIRSQRIGFPAVGAAVNIMIADVVSIEKPNENHGA